MQKISQLKAKELEQEGKLHESDSFRKIAQTIFNTLLEEKFALSSYLINKAKEGLR